MPFFSIVIPAYKNADYLEACIGSIRRQSFVDWEAIVVVDGSPDDSSAIATRLAESDRRVRVIDKPVNEGTHLARRSGVLAAEGSYIYLLDADDQLLDGALDALASALAVTDADMLHFGINVVGVDISDAERLAFENYINRPMKALNGLDIRDAAFDAGRGFLQDWRVTQRVYSASLLRRAFETMTMDRLGRAQDGYEYFVISCLSRKQVTRNDVVALDYFYGRGENGDRRLTQDDFLRSARDFQKSIDAIQAYAAQVPFDCLASVEGARGKLIELLMNDWHQRLSSCDKVQVVPRLAEVIGADVLATQLCRFSRDEAYEAWISRQDIPSDAPLRDWVNIAEDLHRTVPESGDYRKMHDVAIDHIASVDKRQADFQRYAEQDIRIFVSTH